MLRKKDNETRIAFRFDGGGDVGFGHATRCAALAREAASRFGYEVHAYVRSDSVLEEFLSAQEVAYTAFAPGTDEEEILHASVACDRTVVVLIDRLFPFTREIIERVVAGGTRVCMLHNECEGNYACDAVVFPVGHLSKEVSERLRSRISAEKFYSGFEYAMISDACRAFNGPVDGHISFASGASDPCGVLLKLSGWAASLQTDFPLRALYGNSFRWKAELEALEPAMRGVIEVEPFTPELFFGSRFAVCAFGVSVYELLYHQVPFLTVAHIPKSAEGSRTLADHIGLPVDLGLLDDLTQDRFVEAFKWLTDPLNEKIFSKRISGLVDGRGVERVAEILHRLSVAPGKIG